MWRQHSDYTLKCRICNSNTSSTLTASHDRMACMPCWEQNYDLLSAKFCSSPNYFTDVLQPHWLYNNANVSTLNKWKRKKKNSVCTNSSKWENPKTIYMLTVVQFDYGLIWSLCSNMLLQTKCASNFFYVLINHRKYIENFRVFLFDVFFFFTNVQIIKWEIFVQAKTELGKFSK